MLNTMNILLIGAGAGIIAVVLIGIFLIMASIEGWRVAAGILAVGVTLTAVVTGAALLIGYGMGGHL